MREGLYMKCHITETASFADDILNHYSTGTVHSVYRKTINLHLGPALVALQAASSPLSPVSLITNLQAPEMGALSIQPEDPVSTDGQSITIHSHGIRIAFDLSGALVFDSFLPDQAVPVDVTAVKEAIRQSGSGGFSELFSPEPGKASSDFGKEAFLAVAKKRLKDARRLSDSACYEEASSSLAGLLGLGIGLTPAGDDFLCGFLAGLRFAGQWEHPFARLLRKEISQHLGDTNDISRTFLSCALQSHFSRPVKELPYSDTSKILSSFCQIGHSSGIDTLCGIFYASCFFAALS